MFRAQGPRPRGPRGGTDNGSAAVGVMLGAGVPAASPGPPPGCTQCARTPPMHGPGPCSGGGVNAWPLPAAGKWARWEKFSAKFDFVNFSEEFFDEAERKDDVGEAKEPEYDCGWVGFARDWPVPPDPVPRSTFEPPWSTQSAGTGPAESEPSGAMLDDVRVSPADAAIDGAVGRGVDPPSPWGEKWSTRRRT